MHDESQFADMVKFSNCDYAEEHRTIYWCTQAVNACHEFKVVTVDV